jgi:hypothetical protein
MTTVPCLKQADNFVIALSVFLHIIPHEFALLLFHLALGL